MERARVMENTSGQGKSATVPAEIDRWNWGAFLLNWIWGIGNNTFIALLMFVPFINMVMPFVLGAKGSAWAWRNNRWESVEHFKRVQRKWAIGALIAYAAIIGLFAILVFSIMAGMKSSEAYTLAVEKLETSQEAVSVLGEPITTGSPMGSIEVSGPSGYASMSFSAEGSVQSGTVYIEAVKELGRWEINAAVLELDDSGLRIDLNRY